MPLPNASTAADVREEAEPLQAALRTALSAAGLVQGAPLELSAGSFQSFTAVRVEEEPVNVEALAASTGPWRLGTADPSVAKWLRLTHTTSDGDIPSAMQQVAEEQAAATSRAPTPTALVEFCSEGTISKEGGVCCPSSCDQCGGEGCSSEGGPQPRHACCIDQIHASNKVSGAALTLT